VTEDKGQEKEQNCSVFLLFIGGVWIEEKSDCVKKTIGAVQEVSRGEHLRWRQDGTPHSLTEQLHSYLPHSTQQQVFCAIDSQSSHNDSRIESRPAAQCDSEWQASSAKLLEWTTVPVLSFGLPGCHHDVNMEMSP
jgi:hypothetical protein